MKKTICLLMGLSLALMLLCGGALSETDVTGVWYGDLFGSTAVLTIENNGTYQIKSSDIDAYFGTWTLSDDRLMLDEGTENEISLKMDEEHLILSVIGLTVLFQREMPQQYMPAAVRSDAAIEEFAGEWAMTHMNAGELWFYSDTVGIRISLNINDIDAMVFLQVDSNENYVLNMELAASGPRTYCAEMQGVFKGGVLTLTELLPDSTDEQPKEVSSEKEIVPVVWEVRLLEDGTLCVTETTDLSISLSYYMTPVAAISMAE